VDPDLDALTLSVIAATLHLDDLSVGPHDLLHAWSFEPGIVIPLVLAGALYVVGCVRLARRAGWTAHRRGQALAFAAGWATLAVALVSPLHPLGETLFAAHMAQHELLMVVAAPLLVLARPLVPWLWALPIGWRRALGALGQGWIGRLWHRLTQPIVAFALHAVAIVLWHLPRLYDLTLGSDAIHAVQHLSFLGTALLFWWSLTWGAAAAARWGVAIVLVTATMAYTSVLGVILTFARVPLFPAYGARAAAWGLTALEDQQLAGLIMWIPAGIAYLVAALAFAAGWMRASERRVRLREAARFGVHA
jgi:putative membrane protein